MFNKQQHITTITNLIATDYPTVISNDYGISGILRLKEVLKEIPKIFVFLNLEKYNSIQIFKSENVDLRTIYSNYIEIQNYEQLVGINSEKLIIQINNNSDLVVITEDFDDSVFLDNNFYYLYQKTREGFCTKSQFCDVEKPSGSFSIFSISTFKDLDEALISYKNHVAKNAACALMKSSFSSDKRIFFKPKPEFLLRDSLTYYLKARLRGENLEIRPEQNVDDSHPIDIKVSWGFTNHIALIEVKWIGKSIKSDNTSFTATYADRRANDGSQQLADYLESNLISVPSHNTKGYLVVFDLRRNNTNLNTTEVNDADGNYFENREIIYNPDHRTLRNDFALPTRMFIKPICTAV